MTARVHECLHVIFENGELGAIKRGKDREEQIHLRLRGRSRAAIQRQPETDELDEEMAVTDYHIREIDPIVSADTLHWLNEMEPRVSRLWNSGTSSGDIGGSHMTAKVTPQGSPESYRSSLAPGIGYLKRGYVLPEHRGNHLQSRFIKLREQKARKVNWTTIVTDVGGDNTFSQRNLEKAGYVRCYPEQPWGPAGSVYYVKRLQAPPQ